MRRNRPDSKSIPPRVEHPGDLRQPQPKHLKRTSPSLNLRHVEEDSLATMDPGDIIVFDDTASLKSQVESIFFAVLACPLCGILGLITSLQYFGAVPVMCGSDRCSCRFRIDDETRLVYLPVS